MSPKPHRQQDKVAADSAAPIRIQRLHSLHHFLEAADLGIRLLRRTPYAKTTVDHTATVSALQRSALPPDGCTLGAYKGETLVAVIAMQVGAYFWTHPTRGERFASDLFFASEHPGAGLRILRAGIAWAFEQPRVVECTFGVSSELGTDDQYDKLYARVGAKRLGGMYMIRRNGK